ELTLAIDSILFPHSVLMPTLEALSQVFPYLPVSLFTEGIAAPEQRLRDGSARLAIYSAAITGVQDFEAEFLVSIPVMPVVAAHHPLARERGLIPREVLERHVQLVITDRTRLSGALSVGILSSKIWRFDDPSTCYKYLLAGFGWRHMPLHMVE